MKHMIEVNRKFNPDYFEVLINGIKSGYIHRERATWLTSNNRYSYQAFDLTDIEIGAPQKSQKTAAKFLIKSSIESK